jgi:large subunit ribosomal protein L9
MKLILREHVDHLGERGEVVDVARGYARNYLIPKGLAFEATVGNRRQLEQQRRVWEVKDAKEVREAEQIASRIAGLELTVERRAGETGTLYGSVTNSDVAGLLRAHRIEIDRRRILLVDPIKALGDYEIAVRLHPRVQGRVRLRVLGEGGATAPADAAARSGSESAADAEVAD